MKIPNIVLSPECLNIERLPSNTISRKAAKKIIDQWEKNVKAAISTIGSPYTFSTKYLLQTAKNLEHGAKNDIPCFSEAAIKQAKFLRKIVAGRPIAASATVARAAQYPR